MTDKISNTFKLSEHLRLGKFMSIGHTALLFAASSSFTILCIIYCLSVFSEETRLRYHLFGMMGVVFVILSAFLLHFLLAKSELSDFLPHRRNIVYPADITLLSLRGYFRLPPFRKPGDDD